MSMNIEEALAWIHSRVTLAPRLGLERVETLLEMVDNPHRAIPTIHIAGTNGKGSTVTYLRYMLEELGLTVGTFTSPYIEAFNERIAINGVHITDEKIIEYVQKYKPLVEKMDTISELSGITEFEILTVIAFDYFKETKVDILLLEVGLGGLLDSTNVISPILTAITTIGLDHIDILGHTLEEIAAQKSGIIKQGIPVVTGNIVSSALQVIEETAHNKNSRIYMLNRDYQVTYVPQEENWGECFNFSNQTCHLDKLFVSLLGKHQVENAGLAVQLFCVYCQEQNVLFKEEYVYAGLSKAFWPARMEKVLTEPDIILDGAHNVHAMLRLVDNIENKFTKENLTILFSALTTKDIHEMIGMLKNIPHVKLVLTTFDYPKAMTLEDVEQYRQEGICTIDDWQNFVNVYKKESSAESTLLITGSLYFVSQVRAFLK
ncbi:bifunctional folylpolyglutamate synthase/dihydrofolate synthase [Carnobacteriaceae bacterium zg-84]|uniref:bifunctional folylpolyglutamate synthase/dihydrofolate synthase n=1 Tax=Granulicatella sp. zg-84 TaxID=2678503 RepID=UPI0013C221BF|nr:folylpolyglutamate synthase/dihydrofolate synthase family protein [Granulicatella sp. zg-84]NEW66800.1 bifunctional folylpolyglutamate synthase/dihydrofolate synthase [Granulicatella sp. zg-84]QMI85480.1 bifunctional folylpolyglutamate synthase/dihydrofolate synthase [Carnobacteriaceae bacterium zg-84]